MGSLKRHIFLIGMPGSGKSSLGKRVANTLGLPYVDTDLMLMQILNMDTKKILETYGEKAFRNAETNLLIHLLSMQPGLISTGGGLPLIEINSKIIKDNGFVVLIDRPIESIKSNIRIEKRPLLVKEGANELSRIYELRMPLYKEVADVVLTNTRGFQEGVSELENICKSQM